MGIECVANSDSISGKATTESAQGVEMSTSAAGQPDEASPSPVPNPVAVLTQFIAEPGREAKLCDGLLRVVEPARSESGNLGYDLHQVKNKPWAFYVLANWADQAFYRENWTGQPVLDKHMNTPGFHKVVRAEIDPLLTVPRTGLTMTMISAPGPIRAVV
jgi:quinol monooxygenase YgiN